MVLHATLEGHLHSIRGMQFSPDSHLLATGSEDKTVRLWDLVAEASQDKLEGHSGYVTAIVSSPCSHLIASGSSDSTVKLWDSATGTIRYTLDDKIEPPSHPRAMVFSPNSELLAAGYDEGTVKLWDPATGASLFALQGHTNAVTAVGFSPDGHILASGSDDNTVILWDPATGASLFTLQDHTDPVTAVGFSPDGQILASGSYSTIILWDPLTGASRRMLGGDTLPNWNELLEFATDCDESSCTSQSTLEDGFGIVKIVSFSPDSQLIACASDDAFVMVWRIEQGTLVQRNKIYYGGNLSFNQDGSQLEISGRLIQISSTMNDSTQQQVWITASYAMDAENEWVTYKGCKVLRLPRNRRPCVYAVHNKTLLLGGESGLVTRIQFSSTTAPPCT